MSTRGETSKVGSGPFATREFLRLCGRGKVWADHEGRVWQATGAMNKRRAHGRTVATAQAEGWVTDSFGLTDAGRAELSRLEER